MMTYLLILGIKRATNLLILPKGLETSHSQGWKIRLSSQIIMTITILKKTIHLPLVKREINFIRENIMEVERYLEEGDFQEMPILEKWKFHRGTLSKWSQKTLSFNLDHLNSPLMM